MRSCILVVVALLGGCDAGKLTCKDAVVKARATVELGDRDVEAMIGACELHDWAGTMRSCVANAKDEEALAACTNPGDPGGSRSAMAKLTEFADQMCACHDSTCAQKISDEMVKWGQEQAKQQHDPPKMSEQMTKRFTEVGERLGKCMQQAMTPPPAPQNAPLVEDR